MEPDGDYSQERLQARAQIQDVMYRWCRAVDRCDWATVRDVFHADGHDDHGIYRGGVDGLIAWLSERHKTILRSMHLVGNMLIEFADADNAMTESYSLALQRYAAEGEETRRAIAGGVESGARVFDMLMTGRYVDHFQRRGREWRIFRRTVVFDNSLMFPVAEGGAQLGGDWAVSTRGADDPLWTLRAALALMPAFRGL